GGVVVPGAAGGVRVSPGGPPYGACTAHPARVPRIAPRATAAKRDLMGWMLFEAMLALAALVAAVWWTFRGRVEDDDDPESADRPQ
ncbi:MAG TPA: hypothetical protein VIN75_27080, partial [Burkholderiaceae bacterium]